MPGDTPLATAHALIGLGILGLWAVLLGTGQVPELQTEPLAIGFHIAIEAAMGVLSLVSAVALWRGWPRRRALILFTNGMLAYSVVNSAGYYAERGDFGMIGMFAGLLVFAGFSSARMLGTSPQAPPPSRG